MLISRPCSHCEESFVPGRKSQLFCARSCRDVVYRGRYARRRGTFATACAVCGEEFQSREPKHKFCGRTCRNRALYDRKIQQRKKTKPLHLAACDVCAAPFIPLTKRHRTCSNVCSLALKVRRDRAAFLANHPPKIRTCTQCGKAFANIPGNKTKRRGRCSEECVRQHTLTVGAVWRARKKASMSESERRLKRERSSVVSSRYHQKARLAIRVLKEIGVKL